MVDGCQIRELPDGGKEFVLDDPALSFIRIDEQSRLQFGTTEVVIGIPFTVEVDGSVHHLDPHRTEALGPLVALFPGTMRWLWTSAEGELTAVFESGAKVKVTPDAMSKAWSVGNVYCTARRGAVSRRPGRAGAGRPGGRQLASSSGWRAATMRRMPSRQATVVVPTSSCIRVRSIWTLSMVSRVGAKRTGVPVSSDR